MAEIFDDRQIIYDLRHSNQSNSAAVETAIETGLPGAGPRKLVEPWSVTLVVDKLDGSISWPSDRLGRLWKTQKWGVLFVTEGEFAVSHGYLDKL